MQKTPDAELLRAIGQLGDSLSIDSFESLNSGCGIGDVYARSSKVEARVATQPIKNQKMASAVLENKTSGDLLAVKAAEVEPAGSQVGAVGALVASRKVNVDRAKPRKPFSINAITIMMLGAFLDLFVIAMSLALALGLKGLAVDLSSFSLDPELIKDWYPVKVVLQTTTRDLLILFSVSSALYFAFFRIVIGWSAGQFLCKSQKREGFWSKNTRNDSN